MKHQIYRKIEYYLYNYDYFDIRIENIVEGLSNAEYNQNYYKYIKNKSSSLEDQVIRNINIEQKIYKLKKWKSLITFVLDRYKEINILYYKFINLKYFRKCNSTSIQKELNLSLKEQKHIQTEILQYISFIAVEKCILINR